jgi:hypothetical protein
MWKFLNAGLGPFGDCNEYLPAQKEISEFLHERGLQDLFLLPFCNRTLSDFLFLSLFLQCPNFRVEAFVRYEH